MSRPLRSDEEPAAVLESKDIPSAAVKDDETKGPELKRTSSNHSHRLSRTSGLDNVNLEDDRSPHLESQPELQKGDRATLVEGESSLWRGMKLSGLPRNYRNTEHRKSRKEPARQDHLAKQHYQRLAINAMVSNGRISLEKPHSYSSSSLGPTKCFPPRSPFSETYWPFRMALSQFCFQRQGKSNGTPSSQPQTQHSELHRHPDE